MEDRRCYPHGSRGLNLWDPQAVGDIFRVIDCLWVVNRFYPQRRIAGPP